jgi:hypothetical protein
LTVTWTPTRGTITPLNPPANTQAQWNTPSAVGVDSITVRVSDGTVSTTVIKGIKVGTAFTGSEAPAVFRKTNSPYIITVNPGVVLAANDPSTTIEPGTELLLETANMVFDVTDSLIAVGTPIEPISIRPNVRDLNCGDDRGWWEGIKIGTGAAVDGYVELDHVEVWYARFAVRLRDQGSAVIRNSDIRCSQENGVLHEGSGVLLIEDTRISDGELDGIGVDALTFLPDSILIRGCEIAFNGRTGIALDLDDQLQEVPIIIEYSDIANNGEHGITLRNAVFPQIHFNRLAANGVGGPNGLNHIWLINGFPNGAPVTQLNATCNFWGAPVTVVATIEATVRDSQDTGTIGTDVIVAPWSNENPLTTTSTCVLP